MTLPGDHGNQDGGELIPFPIRQPPGHHPGEDLELADTSDARAVEHVGPVYEAELVDDTPPAKSTSTVVRLVQPVIVVVRQARQHEPTVRASKATARHLLYVATGLLVILKRLWLAKTNSRYEQILSDRFEARDWDRLADWETRSETARQRRHDRRMDWMKAPIEFAKAVAAIIGTLVGLMLVIGIFLAIGNDDLVEMVAPFVAFAHFVVWLIAAVAVAWGFLLFILPFALLVGLWHAGWKAGAAPSWLRVEHDNGQATVIDEAAIAHALGNLGISALTQAVRRGHQFIFTKIPARDGERGVSASVRLTAGVAAREVVDRKPRLAANFGRSAVETWPKVGDDEQVLDLFIADRGALDTGAGPWPLLEATEPIDVFRGVPVGKILRGDPAVPPLDGTSWLIGGRPGQGKTNFTRLLVMGACLDPRAEKWVHVLADNADYDPLADQFARYAVGMGNEVAEAAMQAFNDLLAEIQRRGRVMREQGVASAAEAGFHPLVAAFDEVHRLFQHREFGGDAAFVAEDLVKQARKYGIILILTTQSPTATSIPRAITREVICRVAYSVIDQVGNDALLGDGSYRNGVRATELRPGSKHSPGDRGKALTVGVVPDSDWELLLGHHVDLAGVRHVANLARSFAAGAETRTAEPPRDLLTDIADVVKLETPAGEVPALLRSMFPRCVAYQRLTKQGVVDRLKALGVDVPKTQNRFPVRPADVQAALSRRSG